MSIIGIITSERQTKEIKKELEKDNHGEKIEVIRINPESIENIKNIKFEIIVIQERVEKLRENKRYLKEMLKNTKYLLLNTDISIDEENLKNINLKILTYGLKHKATITASSIEGDTIIISIQRGFKDLRGNIVEQQEIPIKSIKNVTKDLYISLIKTAIINILGVENR